jgi:predicted dienelactone hydrolase
VVRDAEPEPSGAPYPVLLTGVDSSQYIFKSHLVSRGFVMAVVKVPDSADYAALVVDAARDYLFVVDQLASNPPEGLEEILDTDHMGVAGYSFEGAIPLALSGARWNPEHYLLQCAQAGAAEPPPPDWWIELMCSLTDRWADFAQSVGDEITASEDGLWQPLTNERIRAVMPMAPDGALFYGEEGLAAADRPIFMLGGTDDPSYRWEFAYIFEHLKVAERYMVSFVGKGHSLVFNPEPVKRINHFATAFVGYYLQDKSEYADYFSEGFVTQFDDLAWGIVDGE